MNDKKVDMQNKITQKSDEDEQNNASTEANNENKPNNYIYAEDGDMTIFDNSCGCEDPVDLYDEE